MEHEKGYGSSMRIFYFHQNSASFWKRLVTNRSLSPNQSRERKRCSEELARLFSLCSPNWRIGSDLNVFRFLPEKSNKGRVTRSMRDFNCFIRETSLKDLTLYGADFTWSNCKVNPLCCTLDNILLLCFFFFGRLGGASMLY